MKSAMNINTIDELSAQSVTTSSQNRGSAWFVKISLLLCRSLDAWNEMSTPPGSLSKKVSSRTWRRHSALISCLEEQKSKQHCK
ncbi:MAG: hypothetical protein P8Y24_00400 [Gammaproteobacteria bacterium]